MSYYHVTRGVWIEDREEYDYEFVATDLERRQVDKIVEREGDLAYLLIITEWQDDPEVPYMEECIGQTNGEEWALEMA